MTMSPAAWIVRQMALAAFYQAEADRLAEESGRALEAASRARKACNDAMDLFSGRTLD